MTNYGGLNISFIKFYKKTEGLTPTCKSFYLYLIKNTHHTSKYHLYLRNSKRSVCMPKTMFLSQEVSACPYLLMTSNVICIHILSFETIALISVLVNVIELKKLGIERSIFVLSVSLNSLKSFTLFSLLLFCGPFSTECPIAFARP